MVVSTGDKSRLHYPFWTGIPVTPRKPGDAGTRRSRTFIHRAAGRCDIHSDVPELKRRSERRVQHAFSSFTTSVICLSKNSEGDRHENRLSDTGGAFARSFVVRGFPQRVARTAIRLRQ